MAFVVLVNFVNTVNNINPIKVDTNITVKLLLNANKKRLLASLYFSEILSSK